MKNLAIILFLIVCNAGCYNNSSSTKQMDDVHLPSLEFLLVDSTTKVNTDYIEKGTATIFFFFTPECPYCKAMTEQIIANISSFPDVRFYFLTNYPVKDLKSFYNNFRLDKYPHIIVAKDYKYSFIRFFNPSGVPYLVIYSKEKRLKQKFLGYTDIMKIKNVELN